MLREKFAFKNFTQRFNLKSNFELLNLNDTLSRKAQIRQKILKSGG